MPFETVSKRLSPGAKSCVWNL